MEYELSDSSGTDDDLPPSHQNRFQRPGHVASNGRSAVVGSGTFPRMQNDMETEIHNIEQEAYTSVLRAFKAQSDAITWEKESLITELRKELRVSDEEHRELLSRVNADDIIRRIRSYFVLSFSTEQLLLPLSKTWFVLHLDLGITICAVREWRKASGLQPGTVTTAQTVHDHIPSPTVSASRKKPKTSQSVASLSLGAPSPVGHPSMQPSTSALRHGPPSGAKTKKPKSNTLTTASSMKSMQFPSTGLSGRTQATNRGSTGAFATNEPAEAATYDPLIGRKVWTRWPEDNHFYEAVITDCNPTEGRHALVYDINTASETWEWVNLKEISQEDIRWDGEDPGISRRGGRPGAGRGVKKSAIRGGAITSAGRGRGMTKVQPKNDFPLLQNGSRKKQTGDIEILHTDTLIKEVEKVFGSNNPDPTEMEKAKKKLKEHEQALIDAIARLEDASDGESDGELPITQRQSMDQERGWKKRQYDKPGEGRAVEGSNSDKMARNGRAASEYSHEAGNDI